MRSLTATRDPSSSRSAPHPPPPALQLAACPPRSELVPAPFPGCFHRRRPDDAQHELFWCTGFAQGEFRDSVFDAEPRLAKHGLVLLSGGFARDLLRGDHPRWRAVAERGEASRCHIQRVCAFPMHPMPTLPHDRVERQVLAAHPPPRLQTHRSWQLTTGTISRIKWSQPCRPCARLSSVGCVTATGHRSSWSCSF